MTAGLECPLRISCAAFASWWEHCDNKLEANTLRVSLCLPVSWGRLDVDAGELSFEKRYKRYGPIRTYVLRPTTCDIPCRSVPMLQCIMSYM